MCGIVGFNWEDKSLLKKALAETRHRGPDYSGVFFAKNLSLGHNRLSIIDLSSSGNQPMSNEEGDIWITFNGEIYNFQELKTELKQHHEFKSSSDTELLLHLYEEKGPSLVRMLQGMFAFCIYDSRKNILLLARDRLGKKPLYYYSKENKFMFCSEIKGILCNKEVKRELNHESLKYFLAFRANTSSSSLFKNIHKLEPGHTLIYDLKNNTLKKERYWQLSISEENLSESYYLAKLSQLLEDSVRSRLMSDVPYGAYLSGGVDSGTIVSLMSQFSSQKLKTFSVGFNEEKDKETDDARFLADKIGTDHHELLIDSSSIKHLPDIVHHLDEPMSDPTSIPIYLLSQYAKKHCTVILTGEGADEIFAGYPQYKFMKIRNSFLSKFPKGIKNSLPSVVNLTPKFLLNKCFKFASSLGDKGKERFSRFIKSESLSEQYLNQVTIFNQEEQEELLDQKINLYQEYGSYFGSSNIISSCQKIDLEGNMVEDLLMKLDKNAMAFAIEGRVPFLDYRIVELAFQMPSSLKLKGFSKDKYILRKMASNLVPKQTTKRKKRHFFVPIDEWMKELDGLKEDLLSSVYLKKQKIFNPNYVTKINSEFKNSKLFYSRQLWSLLSFQIWYKQYIENEKIKI